MKAVGLIVEYNPLHNGHLHHIEQARLKSNAEIVIAIMSGNFLQRGEPAIVDKFTRAKMALEQHVDLVFELPTVYAIQHSDLFAHGSIRILDALHVDDVIFGSEQGEINSFIQTCQLIDQNRPLYDAELQKQLNKGHSYRIASKFALQALGSDCLLDLTMPNNILGLSYLKAQQQINSEMKIDTIKRIQADYHQSELSYPITSATSIRNQITDSLIGHTSTSLAMPLSSFQLLKDYWKTAESFHHWELYFPLLKYRILSDTVEQLRAIHGMTEGLEHRLKKMIHSSQTFFEFLNKIQTKRYTKTRLQRLFVHLLLQLTKEEMKYQLEQVDQIDEVRLLAMSENGQAYLRQLKQSSDLKIVSQLKRNLSDRMMIDEKATSIYYLPLKNEAQSILRQQEFKPPF